MLLGDKVVLVSVTPSVVEGNAAVLRLTERPASQLFRAVANLLRERAFGCVIGQLVGFLHRPVYGRGRNLGRRLVTIGTKLIK